MGQAYATMVATVETSNFLFGQTTTNNSSAVQLTSDSQNLFHGVWLSPKSAATYYIGKSDVSATNGIALYRGSSVSDGLIHIPCTDASQIYVINGDGAGKVISWMAV